MRSSSIECDSFSNMLLFISLLKELDIQFLLTKDPNKESFIIEVYDIDKLIKHFINSFK
jgi:hypothetical protein